jgi:hypothetical protein
MAANRAEGHSVAIPTMPGAIGGSFIRNARIDFCPAHLAQHRLGAKSLEPNFDPIEDSNAPGIHNSNRDCY